MIYAAFYAIGAAVVLGWLLHIHVTARYLLTVAVIAIAVGAIWAAKMVTRRVDGDRQATEAEQIRAMPPPRPEGVPPPARPTR